jgi:hypothetical protein
MQCWTPKPVYLIQALACAFSCLLWLGCLAAPMRVPTHTQGPAGKHASADLSFLRVGATSRTEVLQQLGWADTGLKNDRLFLGRWMSSKWAAVTAVYGGGGSADRIWHTHNLIIEFDEKGVVSRYRLFSDDALAKELSTSLQNTQTPALDLSTPVVVSVAHHHGVKNKENYGSARLSLTRDSVEFREPGQKSHEFQVARQTIGGLTYAGWLHGDDPDSLKTNVTLHLSEQTSVGKSLTIRLDIPTLVILVQYIAQNHPLAASANEPWGGCAWMQSSVGTTRQQYRIQRSAAGGTR